MDHSLIVVLVAATITALATGLGALPLLLLRNRAGAAVGVANALAAGLMLAASFALVQEGLGVTRISTVAGLIVGLACIAASDRLLARRGARDVADLADANAAKALLILGVMTAHSFAEGVGVGVSFAGRDGLGAYISAAIALHNVPEGLAIALVLVPRGTPVWKAALLAIFTSLPQPIMAVPAYLFVGVFEPLLPVGLGLAAGAMVWMVLGEIFPDAIERITPEQAATYATLAFATMVGVQALIL
jgi:zinc transporter ZupT